jgi:hypothetical protein
MKSDMVASVERKGASVLQYRQIKDQSNKWKISPMSMAQANFLSLLNFVALLD